MGQQKPGAAGSGDSSSFFIDEEAIRTARSQGSDASGGKAVSSADSIRYPSSSTTGAYRSRTKKKAGVGNPFESYSPLKRKAIEEGDRAQLVAQRRNEAGDGADAINVFDDWAPWIKERDAKFFWLCGSGMALGLMKLPLHQEWATIFLLLAEITWLCALVFGLMAKQLVLGMRVTLDMGVLELRSPGNFLQNKLTRRLAWWLLLLPGIAVAVAIIRLFLHQTFSISYGATLGVPAWDSVSAFVHACTGWVPWIILTAPIGLAHWACLREVPVIYSGFSSSEWHRQIRLTVYTHQLAFLALVFFVIGALLFFVALGIQGHKL